MAIRLEDNQDIQEAEVEQEVSQEAPVQAQTQTEAPTVTQKTAPHVVVDGYRVRVTDGVKFMWGEQILEYRRGEVINISKEMFDVLWKRGVITLEP